MRNLTQLLVSVQREAKRIALLAFIAGAHCRAMTDAEIEAAFARWWRDRS